MSLLLLGGAALYGQLATGAFESFTTAVIFGAWLLYIFTHLRIAILIAGIIGSPGCEMRAFHNLYTRITGTPTKEHYCPVGPLHPIDQWESNQAWLKD